MTRRRGQAGFTLIELMITLVVTVFGLMGMMALHISLTAGNDAASRSQEALAVGSEVMESLRSKRATDMMMALTGSTTTLPPVDIINYQTLSGRNGVSYQVDAHVSQVGASANLWKLRIVVNWVEDSSSQTHTLPIELVRTTQEAL
ncbi:MAG TPA: prepilin-type N-terminal cleavage/methylation domain-containing protein [Kofleriaceae bacterium]|nr:prepilin-type N-terminal cleavage/methylation domain-containing protein [Kofleriaceae bacterium]